MRYLVTGASGFIGQSVVPELLGAGHEVVGLVRSDASAAVVTGMGAEARRGDLDDLDGLREAATAADGVLHLAFKHDLIATGDFAGAGAANMLAVEAIGDALKGSGKSFVIVGGTLMLAVVAGRPGTEDDVLEEGPRIDAENAVIALADDGVRSSVVRLPPLVHGPSDHGFGPALIGIARRHGFSGYVEDGANRWPSVHVADAARLCRLALEQAPAGSRLHAVADEGVPFREIAEAIGRGADLPVKSVVAEDAPAHFGFLGGLVGLDNPVSAARTGELLGWRPTGPGLLEDLGEGHYFEQA